MAGNYVVVECAVLVVSCVGMDPPSQRTGLLHQGCRNVVRVLPRRNRHDPCVGLRATPIAEAMVALVLMDHYLRNRAQNADVESGTPIV